MKAGARAESMSRAQVAERSAPLVAAYVDHRADDVVGTGADGGQGGEGVGDDLVGLGVEGAGADEVALRVEGALSGQVGGAARLDHGDVVVAGGGVQGVGVEAGQAWRHAGSLARGRRGPHGDFTRRQGPSPRRSSEGRRGCR